MTQALQLQNQFKNLSRINLAPIKQEKEIYQPIPINRFLSLSPWTVEGEAYFYDQKTVDLIETHYLINRLLKVVLMTSLIAIPLYFKESMKLSKIVTFISCECFVFILIAWLSSRLLKQADQRLGRHFTNMIYELQLLSIENPSSQTRAEEALAFKKELDRRVPLMIQQISSRFTIDDHYKQRFLSLSSVCSAFLEENMDESKSTEEKELLANFQKMLIENKEDFGKKFLEFSQKIRNEIEIEFNLLMKQGKSLEEIQKQLVRLLKTIDLLMQFLSFWQIQDKQQYEVELDKIKKDLKFLANLDPNKIPQDIEFFAKELLDSFKKQEAYQADEELSWIVDPEFPIPQNHFRNGIMQTMRRYSISEPNSLTTDEFWDTYLMPELFIELNIFLKNNPLSAHKEDIHLLISKLKKLEISPVYFRTHACGMLQKMKGYSEEKFEEKLYELSYYYRLYVLKTLCNFDFEKEQSLA